jgi:type II restriction/modification system DNA methylase subunit YeeA
MRHCINFFLLGKYKHIIEYIQIFIEKKNMKYLKRLTNNEEYTAFKNSEEYVEPHVATIEDKILIYKRNVPMITFTVKASYTDPVTYTAEEGMTWGEWLESEYCEPSPEYHDTSPDRVPSDWNVGPITDPDLGGRVYGGGNTNIYSLQENNSSGAFVYTSSVIKPIPYYYKGEAV